MTRDSGAGENPLFRFPAFKSGVKIPHQYKISMNPESSLDSMNPKKEEQYVVNLPGHLDNLKKRQRPDPEIVQCYEDLKDQICWKKKSFEMIQKSTDELRELLSLHSKKNF